MANTYTPKYNLAKPAKGDIDWDDELNGNFDTIDSVLDNKAEKTHASTHITGGTDIIPNAVAGGNSGLMSGADKANLDSAVSLKHSQGTDTTLGIMTADINMNSHKIINVADPTSAQDAATKNYVDTHATQGIALDQVVLGSQIFG